MRNVLIALDFGIASSKIAEKGHQLAKKMKARTILLHVVAEENYYSMFDSQPFTTYYGVDFFNMIETGNLVEPSLKHLEKIKKKLGDESIETIALLGNFTETTLKIAETKKAEIIVIGSHSHNWFENTLVGTVTSDLLNKSEIPLYIIPVKEHK